MRHNPGAFTLIELLVVVTIIVVLLALLVPAMDKAIEQAERAQCAARLHAWGVALPQYAFQNRRQLLSAVRINGAAPYPSLVRPLNSHGPGDLSAELMGPYIGSVDLQRFTFGEMFYCPSNGMTTPKVNTNAALGAGQLTSLNGVWFAADYAYFGRKNSWNTQNYATKPEEIANHGLGEGKLLMADVLYLWRGGGTNTWWYNHNAQGPSTHDVAWGGPVQPLTGILDITGTNQLMGDGATIWKDRSRFNPQAMADVTQEAGWVSSSPNRNPASDLNFY